MVVERCWQSIKGHAEDKKKTQSLNEKTRAYGNLVTAVCVVTMYSVLFSVSLLLFFSSSEYCCVASVQKRRQM